MFSLAYFVRSALDLHGPAIVVSTACAASARTFIDASQLIASGMCDAAVVGGADSLCATTLRGFASLDLISPIACRPCDACRDGISIGEAAGFALLEREGNGAALLGYGASSDGYHMSAPHPRAIGAIAAMRAALHAGGLSADDIDYVNLHGTATKANDAMEDVAMVEVFGTNTPCSSTKGWTGHTLGASGILEAMIACLCIEQRLIPGCLNLGALDPDFRASVLIENKQLTVRRVMSNAFGFGGINCSLIFGKSGG
jgi:3-oxoacyl-[acyl-carrier-protein] synthase-1